MTMRVLISLVLLASLLTPNQASAEVHALLRPDAERGVFHQVLELVSDGEPADVVFDRRLLRLSVHVEGRRRPLPCAHPSAPSRVVEARVVHLDSSTPRVSEWLDLRMYCTGRALEALAAGARVEARYGFRRRGRARWVVKPEGARTIASLTVPEFVSPAVAQPSGTDGAVRVRLSSASARAGQSPALRLSLRAGAAPVTIYPRDDLYRFRIHGPLGDLECGPRRTPVNPIIDFYRRLRGRRSISASVDARSACPDAFSVPGVYEVTPVVDLVYGGARYALDVTTGSFEGPPALIRVFGRGYVAHPLDDAAAP